MIGTHIPGLKSRSNKKGENYQRALVFLQEFLVLVIPEGPALVMHLKVTIGSKEVLEYPYVRSL